MVTTYSRINKYDEKQQKKLQGQRSKLKLQRVLSQETVGVDPKAPDRWLVAWQVAR